MATTNQSNPLMQSMLSPRGLTWIIAIIAISVFTWFRFGSIMDTFEIGILIGATIGLIGAGFLWQSIQTLFAFVLMMALIGIASYAKHGDVYSANETAFFLKFLFSSQSAFMWMNVLFVLSMLTYFFALWKNSEFSGRVATSLTWSAVAFGLAGMGVRWRESYLINPDYGHIPVSNLYEVFILFVIITAVLYLYYEQKIRNRSLGGFAMAVISAAVGFILWYTFGREASVIQPLVPALKSYWMKIHVPANFVGYGTFALAAMVAVPYLWRNKIEQSGNSTSPWLTRLPTLEVMEDVMYKAIAFGFAFFTIATILGAMWAAEAWGGYWSWDPKETWALIVWLNYAAWLHFRMSKGWGGARMAWWALGGLLVTTFAFLGVNMFLSGLHSYGTL
ncbi:MAG: c-type cytochrome biogenesis protein CcsB [Thiotrichales bacterium]|jgi:cytochrome c-type biogenesis protein CcsB|nr:c-type cytochrome biogenesis protein CcsB [Thiotrichales bacterium]